MFLLRTGIVEHQHASSMFKGLPGYPFTSRFRRHTTRENSEFLTSRIMWSPSKKHWWTFRPSPHIFGPLAERNLNSDDMSPLLRLVTRFRFCLVFWWVACETLWNRRCCCYKQTCMNHFWFIYQSLSICSSPSLVLKTHNPSAKNLIAANWGFDKNLTWRSLHPSRDSCHAPKW